MGLGKRGGRGPSRRKSEPPVLLIFIVAGAIVFGLYYLIQGAQTFVRTGGLGVQESTERAIMVSSATAIRFTPFATQALTPFPSATPIPECQDFRVIVPNAVVRSQPEGAVLTGYSQGAVVCVLGRDAGSEWYTIDSNPETRRRELAYMHESVISPMNPTLTPSTTPTPLPTVTLEPSFTPSATSLVREADSRATLPPNLNVTPELTPEVTPEATEEDA